MSAITFRTERAIPSTSPTASDTPAPAGTGVMRYPSLTTTVPKEFVHRASVAEVMLTDWERTGQARFTVSAQWPRGHSFFTPLEGCHDPLIAAETVRQAGALLAHAEFGVPLGHHFLMWDLAVDVRPEHLLVGGAPASLELDISCPQIKRRGRSLAGLRYEAAIRRDGRPVATAGASFSCMSPAVYRRVRAHRPPAGECARPLLTAPVAPQSVGRMSPMDVVLSPLTEKHRWQLRVDSRHPVLFDHPVDHVPGMVLMEAARQATATVLGRPFVPQSLTASFQRYAELDTPCIIEAHPAPATSPGPGPGPGRSVLVSGHQDGQSVFRCTVTAAPPTP